MPLIFVHNDITRMQVDAIVNAANHSLLGGGGVDGCIHRAAGRELLEECRSLGGCETGKAKVTGGYRLPCKYVIHTVGPVWRGGGYREPELLASCYRESMRLARERGCASIAFPLISAGAYGYPIRDALRIAREEIRAALTESDMTAYLVIFDRRALAIGEELEQGIARFIDERYVQDVEDRDPRDRTRRLELEDRGAINERELFARLIRRNASKSMPQASRIFERDAGRGAPVEAAMPPVEAQQVCSKPLDLREMIESMDAGFSETLLRLIDLRGMTDAQCYKRANVDRKLFSKIRSDPGYRPSKPTVLAFAIALRLSLEETRDLLMKAGFALSHSSKFDIIIEYFIRLGRYDIDEINEALFSFDQSLLGL